MFSERNSIIVLILVVICKDINGVTWTDFGGNAYAFMYVRKDWVDAQKVCQTYGANLVSIDSDQEQSFIQDMSKRKAIWTSGSDRNQESTWAWYSGFRLMSYTNWISGTPKRNRKKNCLLKTRWGKWTHENCRRKFHLICEIQMKGSECDDSWNIRNKKCYRKIDSRMDWTSALLACQHLSANLLSIENRDEMKYIRELYGGEPIWTSAIDGNKPGTWIFASATKKRFYTNWISTKKRKNRFKHCIAIRKIPGSSIRWIKRKCNDKTFKPVCEKLESPPLIPVSPENHRHVDPVHI